MTVSTIPEKIKVEIKLYAKNGKARVQQAIKPFKLYPYAPRDQTPKFVTIKNKQAPDNAPEILPKIDDTKNFEASPIIATLPQVKKATP